MRISFKHFLWAAITFTTVLALALKFAGAAGPVSPMRVVIGFLYVIFVMWASGQLLLIRLKEQKELAAPPTDDVASPLACPLDEVALSLAETYLSLGENIDTVCTFVDARYRDWGPARRATFRQELTDALSERRTRTN